MTRAVDDSSALSIPSARIGRPHRSHCRAGQTCVGVPRNHGSRNGGSIGAVKETDTCGARASRVRPRGRRNRIIPALHTRVSRVRPSRGHVSRDHDRRGSVHGGSQRLWGFGGIHDFALQRERCVDHERAGDSTHSALSRTSGAKSLSATLSSSIAAALSRRFSTFGANGALGFEKGTCSDPFRRVPR